MSDLSQADLCTYVDMAIKALKSTLGHRMMIRDIQKYLKEQYSIDEGMERIKDAEDIIFSLNAEGYEPCPQCGHAWNAHGPWISNPGDKTCIEINFE